jgi:hypothetical protein
MLVEYGKLPPTKRELDRAKAAKTKAARAKAKAAKAALAKGRSPPKPQKQRAVSATTIAQLNREIPAPGYTVAYDAPAGRSKPTISFKR